MYSSQFKTIYNPKGDTIQVLAYLRRFRHLLHFDITTVVPHYDKILVN